ncbi:hypothetical protein NDU88_007499 [Pleurodeles waltl]|uniref:Uncharacterized protein n=1 Tax=Pleurodeles waltl TaxID=8319 RepID=A0AAV7N3V8_PLEWA|nr:hypothetical protein NDU88_007499 [Pleurodeles waltl]
MGQITDVTKEDRRQTRERYSITGEDPHSGSAESACEREPDEGREGDVAEEEVVDTWTEEWWTPELPEDVITPATTPGRVVTRGE